MPIKISKDELTEFYINQKLNAREISKIYHCSKDTILSNLHRYNIRVRTLSESKLGNTYSSIYSKNDNYFSEPSIENCYWAGFIAADGCIINIKNHQKRLTIGLKESDLIILERFKNIIQYNGPIHKNKINNSVYLQIASCNYISNDLEKYFNITSCKSLTLQFPNITDINLCLSYIIGYIDGDGHIGYYPNRKKSKLILGCCGTQYITNWISNFLYKFEKSSYKNQIPHKDKSCNCYSITYASNRAYFLLDILYNHIYNYKLEVLDRKWNKFLQYKKDFPNKVL